MTTDLNQEERWAKRAEAERLYAPNGGLKSWRQAIFQGKVIDVYFNHDLIDFIFTKPIGRHLPKAGYYRIADFCSGTGHIGRRAASGLTKRSRRVAPQGIDDFPSFFWGETRPSVSIPTHKSSLPFLVYPPNSFDAGILRFAMPFIPNHLQPMAMEKMFGVMKEGSEIIVLNDGPIDTKSAELAYEVFIEGIVAGGGEAEDEVRSRLFTCPYEDLKRYGEAAGFVVGPEVDLTDTLIGYTSPDIMARSRGLTDEQKARMKAVYVRDKQENPDRYEPDPNSLRMPWRMHTFKLIKPKR